MHLKRRQWISASVGGLFGLAARSRCENLFAGLPGTNPGQKAKRCVVLWMEGGPSQLETFDLKPGTRTGGSTQTIATRADGIEISEFLPRIAQHMDQLSVIRNLTSREGDHDRGTYYLHTGYTPVPSFPRPAAGSVISRYAEDSDIPKFVQLGGANVGPAFMGPDHAPFTIEDPNRARELLEDLRRHRSRMGLIQKLSQEFETTHPEAMVERRKSMLHRIERLVTTRFIDALDWQKEPTPVQERYGQTDFGKSCLLARRLLECGVHFVEVVLSGWDTHANNAAEVRQLCTQLDGPWASLMEDLKSSGLLDETVVVWMGEFGRTPQINAQNGRDHFPDVTPVVIGGGGLSGGRVIGKTNHLGTEIEGPSHRVADLFATLYQAMGIRPDEEFQTDFGSPTTATEDGKLITDLFT